MKKYRVTAVIEKDEDGYYAYCPELPGCCSQGETFDEALANIKEATALYLETLPGKERESFARRDFITSSLEISIA
jgi:predicted RNase H-like HicB family nuclease